MTGCLEDELDGVHIALPRIIVLITSVRSRVHDLEAVLAALEVQTQPPERVLLRLDGWTEPQVGSLRAFVCSNISADFDAKLVIWRDELPGAGRRWLHPYLLLQCSHTDLILTIDDDLEPDEDYIERTARLVVASNQPVTWHGWSFSARNQRELGAYFEAPQRDLRAVAIGAGCAAFRMDWLIGLQRHPLAPSFLEAGPSCDDDALLSFHLWDKGILGLRPAGPAPLVERAASRAPDASFNVYGARRHAQRLALSLATGCQLIDVPLPPPKGLWAELAAELRAIHKVLFPLYRSEASRVLWSAFAPSAITKSRLPIAAEALFFDELFPELIENSYAPGPWLLYGVGPHTMWVLWLAFILNITVYAWSEVPSTLESFMDEVPLPPETWCTGEYPPHLKGVNTVIVAPGRRFQRTTEHSARVRVVLCPGSSYE